MEVKHYKDPQGNWFLELISRRASELRELEAEHKKLGRKTWMNIYNYCEGLWMLTVAIVQAEERP